MAQSKINKIRGNGSWTGEYGTFYTFEYEFEDGTIGLANHQTDTPKFKEGEFIEYEITGQDKMGNNKIKFIQSNFNSFPKKGNGNNKSFALSYAKDLVVADRISVNDILMYADNFNEWLNK